MVSKWAHKSVFPTEQERLHSCSLCFAGKQASVFHYKRMCKSLFLNRGCNFVAVCPNMKVSSHHLTSSDHFWRAFSDMCILLLRTSSSILLQYSWRNNDTKLSFQQSLPKSHWFKVANGGLDGNGGRGVTHLKVYIFVYTYISVCVQYVHIYTVYSAAVPSFVVGLYSASFSCFIDTTEIQLWMRRWLT